MGAAVDCVPTPAFAASRGFPARPAAALVDLGAAARVDEARVATGAGAAFELPARLLASGARARASEGGRLKEAPTSSAAAIHGLNKTVPLIG